MFYKIIENGYITLLGSPVVPDNGMEITEEEYNEILTIIDEKPEDTEMIVYRLNAETLEYEPTPRPEEPEPEEPEQLYTLDEAAAIIASEVAGNE